MTGPLLEPLDTLPPWRDEYPTLGWQVAEWALGKKTESTPASAPRFRVPAGPTAGAPMTLTDRQLVFLLWWYAIDPVTGDFVVRGGSMRHARGTGKSPLAGFLGCCELVGPVRFDRWHPLTGEPIGKRASMPLVQVAAVSEAQTENTMTYVRAWLERGTPLQVEYHLDPGKQVIYAPASGGIAGGKLQVITSSAATARGGTPSLVLADETGEWTETNGGKRLRATLGENATKVIGGRVLECANAWRPGVGSVAEERWEAWELDQDPEQVVDRPWLMDVREAPTDTDWSDETAIRSALEVVYSDVPWISLDQLMSTILDPAKPIQESQREFGNWRVSDLTTWADRQQWDACGDATAALCDGDEIVLFLDPSETDDATGLVACRVSDGLIVPLWVHEPHALDPAGRPMGPVDPGEIDRRVRLAFSSLKVVAFRSDVHPIEQLARSEWHERYGDDLALWSSKTEAVAYDMRREQLSFARACELTASEIATGELVHNADKVLARHVANTQRRPYREFVSVGKGDRARKIDAAVAMIGARDLRRTLLESDEWKRYQRRKRRTGRKAVVLR